MRELVRDIVESTASRSTQRDLFKLCRLMSGVGCHESDGPSEVFISCQNFIRRIKTVKGWSTSHAQRVGPSTFAAVRVPQ